MFPQDKAPPHYSKWLFKQQVTMSLYLTLACSVTRLNFFILFLKTHKQWSELYCIWLIRRPERSNIININREVTRKVHKNIRQVFKDYQNYFIDAKHFRHFLVYVKTGTPVEVFDSPIFIQYYVTIFLYLLYCNWTTR